MKRARATQARYLMGTIVEIVTEGDEGQSSIAAINAAFEEFERLERIFNRFDEASELSQLNRSAAHTEFIASPDLFNLLSVAAEYAALSGGSFDVTVGPLLELWSRSVVTERLPDAEEVSKARCVVGADKIELDPSRRTVRFRQDGIVLDFGGLAKGYAVDRGVEILRRHGVAGALINAGTSSMAGFGAPGPDGWLIGVRHPLSEDHLIGRLAFRDAALSSSGNYERPLVIQGRSYSHIIDPRCGIPAEGALAATVVTDSAMRAEVMSKMLLLLGCEAAFSLFDNLGWKAEGLLMTETPEGMVGVWCSDGLTGFSPGRQTSLAVLPLE